MSMLHLLLSGCLFVAFAAAGETVKPELKPAKRTPAARIEGKMLTIDVPAGREGLENYAEFTLDLGQYASCHLIGTIRGKFTGFRPDQDRRKGIDLRLSYRADDDSHDRLGGGLFRNESLKSDTLRFGITLDPHAKLCRMRISLDNCSGRAEFDLASLEFTPQFTPPREEYICEYSDAVRARPVRRGVMSPIRNQTDEENFRELRRWNVNLMRLQLNTNEQWARSEPEKYRKFIRDKIDNVIPKVLDLGQKYGRKLFPAISPKKSWIGFWGGFLLALGVAAAMHYAGMFTYPLHHCLIMAAIMNVAGVYGDLIESQWQRHYAIKDSGSVIPGHGGIWDRFDSALMALPAGVIYLVVLNIL